HIVLFAEQCKSYLLARLPQFGFATFPIRELRECLRNFPARHFWIRDSVVRKLAEHEVTESIKTLGGLFLLSFLISLYFPDQLVEGLGSTRLPILEGRLHRHGPLGERNKERITSIVLSGLFDALHQVDDFGALAALLPLNKINCVLIDLYKFG